MERLGGPEVWALGHVVESVARPLMLVGQISVLAFTTLS